ncbi:hypothetical protein VNI00_019199 [Paramarasmius palmivorus]|uniref:Uncharacterized protein n=1 Tax=Paramarasmius palmivorus TaxID=297713 RepID=A0AAW0AQF6_9AGAR
MAVDDAPKKEDNEGTDSDEIQDESDSDSTTRPASPIEEDAPTDQEESTPRRSPRKRPVVNYSDTSNARARIRHLMRLGALDNNDFATPTLTRMRLSPLTQATTSPLIAHGRLTRAARNPEEPVVNAVRRYTRGRGQRSAHPVSSPEIDLGNRSATNSSIVGSGAFDTNCQYTGGIIQRRGVMRTRRNWN